MFADVIVDINHSEVDKIFEYSFSGEECKLGSRVVVPFGNSVINGIVIGVKEFSNFDPNKIRPILRVLDEIPVLNVETLALMEHVKKTCYCTGASALRLFLPSEMRKGKVREQFVNYCSLIKKISSEELEINFKRAIKQKQFLEYISDGEKYKLSEMNNKFGASAVKAVLEKGYIQITVEKNFRSPYNSLDAVSKTVNLTEAQKNAIDSVNSTDKTISLLYGVTGSGKTEVYLSLISQTVNLGKTAVMLVPEIALTPQMLKQLRARFGTNAAIIHSGLSVGERFDEWWRIKTGEAKIVVGVRSAIFAPLENIGLIIIDEEHDASYSSESNPRYNTLDVAKFRADFYGAKIIIGSATPSIDSFLNAQNGNYNLITLPERINKKPLPEVEIVDMRKEVKRGNSSQFSRALLSDLEQCLKNGNQAIIFLNQRGFSKSVICTECGHVQKCESCDVSLTYHKEDESLLCHYCGAKYKMISACTECGSKFIRYGGIGTERVVFELKKEFPNAKILRMDRDTTATKEGHFRILNEFSERKADILVGTQMIAKGHDFPSVTLVGILDADQSLHFSDYRSAERTFQLLTQVAGRSGRADKPGKVVLQTYSPENIVLKQAINYDYKSFYENEISIRSATGFPPFSDIVRILFTGEDQDLTLMAVKSCYNEILEIYNNNKEKFRFFGCMKAPLKRLQNKFRFQILMRIEKGDKKLLDSLYFTQAKYNKKDVFCYFELNPTNLT